MRIISQGGTIDVPYDIVVVQRYKNDIYFLNRNLTGIEKLIDDIKLARYSTEEKAIKAMEMLRESYASMPIVMQNIDVSEDVAKEFERLKKCGVMVRAENQSSRVDFITNTIFQFPQDDEIEV
jgi:hypothetical protein